MLVDGNLRSPSRVLRVAFLNLEEIGCFLKEGREGAAHTMLLDGEPRSP
jgi:hypothetical protein